MSLLNWLRHHQLTLPAWIIAESARPLAWLAGQVALVGSPIATQMGVSQWDEWTETLTNPDRYDDFCHALSESHEPRGDA